MAADLCNKSLLVVLIAALELTLQCVAGLHCFHCSTVYSGTACNITYECSDHEICLLKHGVIEQTQFYELGCFSADLCNLLEVLHDSKSRCCATELCNGDPFNIDTGTTSQATVTTTTNTSTTMDLHTTGNVSSPTIAVTQSTANPSRISTKVPARNITLQTTKTSKRTLTKSVTEATTVSTTSTVQQTTDINNQTTVSATGTTNRTTAHMVSTTMRTTYRAEPTTFSTTFTPHHSIDTTYIPMTIPVLTTFSGTSTPDSVKTTRNLTTGLTTRENTPTLVTSTGQKPVASTILEVTVSSTASDVLTTDRIIASKPTTIPTKSFFTSAATSARKTTSSLTTGIVQTTNTTTEINTPTANVPGRTLKSTTDVKFSTTEATRQTTINRSTTAGLSTTNVTTALPSTTPRLTSKQSTIGSTTTAPKSRTCLVCMGPVDICELAYAPTTCSYPNNYCINRLQNFEDGSRTVERRCGTERECIEDWWYATSDDSRCTAFDQKYLMTSKFKCTYCCTVDNCNEMIRPYDSSLYKV